MTHINSFEISGLRGFGDVQKLSLAQPDGTMAGSGLTMLVGPNSGGKSTVIEGFRAMASLTPSPSFTEGKRNKQAGDRIKLRLRFTDGKDFGLETTEAGGSETNRLPQTGTSPSGILVLPSRRYFQPHFGKMEWDRSDYINNSGFPSTRGEPLHNFHSRLFHILKHPDKFDEVLGNVLSPVPNWTIDQADSGQYYLKFNTGNQYHSSDGLGEGIVSLFSIVDAFYDSKPGDVIVIDEPELSLHPMFQRRLARMIADYAKDRQVVYATHSPYFLNIEALQAGARISRIAKVDGKSRIFDLSADTVASLKGLLNDTNNPHILGLNAREVFFLEDGIVLVEGQEDVVCYQRILEQAGITIKGEFFGWGVGGADKMHIIASVLKSLGFNRVVGILDGNRADLVDGLNERFPNFRFIAIHADDVRTKPAKGPKSAVKGLLDETGKIRIEYKEDLMNIFSTINDYFNSGSGV